MATNNPRFRTYTSTGQIKRTYRITRDGRHLTTECVDNNQKSERTCESVAEAKALMNNPAIICK